MSTMRDRNESVITGLLASMRLVQGRLVVRRCDGRLLGRFSTVETLDIFMTAARAAAYAVETRPEFSENGRVTVHYAKFKGLDPCLVLLFSGDAQLYTFSLDDIAWLGELCEKGEYL